VKDQLIFGSPCGIKKNSGPPKSKSKKSKQTTIPTNPFQMVKMNVTILRMPNP
jgi:hypothetical protein